MRLTLNLLWSFFKSGLRQLDIFGCKNNLIYYCRQSKWNSLSFKSNQLLIRRLLNIEIWYIKIQGPWPPRVPKITGNFESYFWILLLFWILNFETKNFFLFKKTASFSFRLYINFVKISKHIFKKTSDYNRDMWNKKPFKQI